MDIPKIKFQKMPLEENIEFVKWAFFEDDRDSNIHYYTLQYFEELKNINPDDARESICKVIEKVVSDYYWDHQEEIEDEIKRYQGIWDTYNDVYFKNLISFLGVNFPKQIKEIPAKIGFIPIFPRYLDQFSFSLAPNLNEKTIVEVSAHETLHFLWFQKWKQIHPETPREHYDFPYIEWKYSEMVTDPILNNNPFKTLFDFKEKGYDSFYELYDGDVLVMDKLRDLYAKDISIEEKMNLGFSYIRSYFKQNCSIKNKNK